MKFNFKIITIISIIIWVILQVILVYSYGVTSIDGGGDPDSYRYLALQAINNSSLYPNDLNYHDNFIFAPGYVNYIILVYSIFGSFKAVLYSQIILNLFIIILLYNFTSKLFNSRIGYISIWLYLLLTSNFLSPIFGYTELLFILLSLLSLYLILSNKWYYIILSGVVLALANWVRPLAIAWMFSVMICFFLNKSNYKKYICYIVGYIVMIMIIGTITKVNFNDFNYSSTTGGWNLIMGANDNCTGNYNDEVFKEGNLGYISENDKKIFSYKQQDSIYMARSVNWILENPVKYISFIPMKVKELFLYDNQYDMSGDSITSQNKFVYLLSKITFSNKIARVLGKLLYWSVLLLSLLSILYIKDNRILLLQGIILITTFMTLITVGHPRYHQIFMPYILISSSFIIEKITSKIKSYKRNV